MQKKKKEQQILENGSQTKRGQFISESSISNDALKKVAAPAVISDQITLFDDETEKIEAETITVVKDSNKDLKLNNPNIVLTDKKPEVEPQKKHNLFDLNRPPKKIIEIETTPEEEKEKLGEAEEAIKSQSTKKKKISNLIFFIINVFVVAGILLYQILGNKEMTSITELFTSGINWWILILTLALNSLGMFADSAKIWLLTWKTTGKNRPFLSYKVTGLGRHYDAITPFAVGGQPFQVFYMSKNGIPASKAVSIPIGSYIFFQISYVTISLFAMISSLLIAKTTTNVGTVLISAGSWLGFSFNFLIVVVVMLVSINKKVGNALISGVLKLLKKLHLIKNYDAVYNKAMGTVNDYQHVIKNYAKSKFTFIAMLILSMGSLMLKYIMPYMIYCTFFGFATEQFMSIFISTVMIDLASSFIPLPGGTGVSELSFTAFFSSLMGPKVFWAMLLWRILTYYSNILRGLTIIVYNYLHGNKKFEWIQKKWKLEEESKNFEAEQLRNFEIAIAKQNKKHKVKEKNIWY